MRRNIATVRSVAMFKKINALPCAKHHFAVGDRNTEVRWQQGGLDVRRHVIGTFVGMGQIRHAGVCCRRHQTGEIVLQIRLHFRVCVFLNDQTGRCVLDKQRQKAVSGDPISDEVGKFIKART